MAPVRATRYRWPAGGAYKHYAAHMRLPRDYWIAEYFIEDFVDYGLDAPPAGYEWVRYGPDMLLINLDTGEVTDAVYGAFDDSTPPDASQDDQPPPDPQSQPQSGPADEANAGMDALNRGDYETAISLLSEALASGALPPADEELAYVERAKAYVAEKNEASALADVNAALALDPGDQEALDLREELDPLSGPTVPDTLDFIVRTLNGQGPVKISVREHDPENNSDRTIEKSFSITAATADVSQCMISYHWKVMDGGSVIQDQGNWFLVGKVSAVTLVGIDQDLARENAKTGRANWSISAAPPAYDLDVYVGDTSFSDDTLSILPFLDEGDANSVEKALEHAARLCGAPK